MVLYFSYISEEQYKLFLHILFPRLLSCLYFVCILKPATQIMVCGPRPTESKSVFSQITQVLCKHIKFKKPFSKIKFYLNEHSIVASLFTIWKSLTIWKSCSGSWKVFASFILRVCLFWTYQSLKGQEINRRTGGTSILNITFNVNKWFLMLERSSNRIKWVSHHSACHWNCEFLVSFCTFSASQL